MLIWPLVDAAACTNGINYKTSLFSHFGNYTFLECKRSWVGLELAFPGVVVGIVVPFSVSISNAFKFLISDIVVSIGLWSWSIDTFFTGNQWGWLVNFDSTNICNDSSDGESNIFHFLFIQKICEFSE